MEKQIQDYQTAALQIVERLNATERLEKNAQGSHDWQMLRGIFKIGFIKSITIAKDEDGFTVYSVEF